MNNETSSTGSTGKWYKRAWKYLSKALWYFLLMLTAGIAIIMFGKSAVNIVGGTLAFAFGFLAVVFAVIILMAVIVRWTTGTRKQGPIVTDATGISRLRGMFSSLWSTRKDIGSSVEPRVIGLVLWILVLISFGALFPKAFVVWWGHQNIFWISQLVAVLLIFFLPAKYSATLFGLVIAVLLWSAVSTTFGPPTSKEVAMQKGVVSKGMHKAVAYTITHDKWTMVHIPSSHWFYFECPERVEVEILDNRVPVGICDSQNPSWVGSKIKLARGTASSAFLMRSIDKDVVKVIVKTWPKS